MLGKQNHGILLPWEATNNIILLYQREGATTSPFFLRKIMAKPWAKQFYKSKEWQRCRSYYIKKAGGLCEECLKKGLINPGEEVHHKIELTPENITDPEIALNGDNLTLLCHECHTKHHKKTKRRWRVDQMGRVEAR